MAGSVKHARATLLRGGALLAGAIVLCWIFPPVRIKRLPAAGTSAPAASSAFDPATAARQFWRERLLPAADQAADLARVVQAIRENPGAARQSFGKAPGVGSHYLFVRGSGRVIERERNVLRLAVDGAPHEVVELRIGPVFGNTVRDGSGLLDVNRFPGLQEFNALAAELNALVEQQVLPALRQKAKVGATIRFAGCAEAPETADDPGEPLFLIVPVQAEVP